MVGVGLGPGAVNMLHWQLFEGGQATGALLLLAQVGALVLMFIAGIETDIDRMREASVTAFVVALSGVVWPFFLGAGIGHLLGLSWKTACFLGGALTATSVSISARTLMDAGRMASSEGTIILGAAVIDDVMGLFVLALLAASTAVKGQAFGLAPMASEWLQQRVAPAAAHPLVIQMTMLSICVALFFVAGYALAKRWLDPLILQMRKLSATEAVPACVLGLVMVYAISAEWLGSVAGITGAYLLGYVFAGSQFKADVERSFYAMGHGLLIPLFFVSIGLSSDYRALSGHWTLMLAGPVGRGRRQSGGLRICRARLRNGLGAQFAHRLRHDVARRGRPDRYGHGRVDWNLRANRSGGNGHGCPADHAADAARPARSV